MLPPVEGKVGVMRGISVALEANNISVIMGDKVILDSVTFHLQYGEVLGLLGPNGSGKSTLIGAVAGVGRMTSGEVFFEGKNIKEIAKRDLARKVAVVPQQNYFYMPFRVIEIVLMGRYPYAGRFNSFGAQDYEIARNSLKAVDLEGFEDRLATELSGGEAQRVAIARALAQEPHILLMDEPTSALDPKHALSMFKLVEGLRKKGCAILIAMHDVNSALRWSDRVMFLKEGKVVCTKKSRDLDTTSLETVFGVKWTKHFIPDVGEIAFPVAD
ncbi:ABC transporter related protein [Thermovirga lienii DSM 17291]|uniref:ABC transporter related protein n=1 Tax=Thermovirga lienii (strain ATCC BAA-1197 / DSM 17291 / Cas60314) TaxID=580340 RepID=G7V7F3_THELD|nr:ABC transporter related protein [Thermovirga lienii DSM 17291]